LPHCQQQFEMLLYLVLWKDRSYFVKKNKKHSDSTKKFCETDIINMLEFLIDNIFVMFDELVFQQTVGIPMGTNWAPLLVYLFLYSYEAYFIQRLLTAPHCQSRGVGQGMKQTYLYLWCPLFQVQCDRCNQRNH
jgi:ACR3 family arsenite efflux pump ArsB